MPNLYAIDIETIAAPSDWVTKLRHEAWGKMRDEIEWDRTAPKGERRYIDQRLTDPAKIAMAIEKKLTAGAGLDNPKDTLNPLTAEPICVVCINLADAEQVAAGFADIGMSGSDHFQIFTDMDKFYQWAATEASQFLGFNIDQFDIPVLRNFQARSVKGTVLRVPAFWNGTLDLRRMFGDLYNKGEVYSTPRDLRHYVATILDQEAQLDGPVKEYLESSFTGADVAVAYVDGKKDKVIRHCTLDTLMVALIAIKLGIYR